MMVMGGKVVLVTGSSRGIGRGIALSLANAGFSVAINYAGNRDAALETQVACRAAAESDMQRFEIFQANIGVESDRRKLVSDVIEVFGDFHALVNNAGVAPKVRGDLLELSEESLDLLLDVNLKGSLFLSQDTAKLWCSLPKEERAGRNILFITSVSSEIVSVNRGDYCITKAALSMTVKLFARRLAADQIGVFEIRPGIINTDMTDGVKEKYDALIESGLVPQLRWGIPEDIGKVVVPLVGGNFCYSSGSVINVDGAMHIQEL